MHVRLTDPLGVVRYDLFRATKRGVLQLSLPLAANDPPGNWLLEVRDLLADTRTHAWFLVTLPPQARVIAGAERRAVTAVNDRSNIFRFARLFHDVTIVKGGSPFNDAAAERLIKVLAPWGVRCKVMPLAEAAKARSLTEEEARTW